MRIRCPECGVERGLLAFLWQATSPAGFRCASCGETTRLSTPWHTASIGLLFGVLLSVLYGGWLLIAGTADDMAGVVLRLAAIVPLAGLAMVIAHRVILRPTGVRRAADAPPPSRYLVAAGGSMLVACGLFLVAVSLVA